MTKIKGHHEEILRETTSKIKGLKTAIKKKKVRGRERERERERRGERQSWNEKNIQKIRFR